MAAPASLPLATLDPVHTTNSSPDVPPTIHDDAASIPPETATSAGQRWNDSNENKWRTISCFFSFIVYGMNDATAGAMVPHLESYYSLPYSIVSLIFLGPMIGCITAAFSSNRLHEKYGRRGVAAFATGSYAISYLGMSLHPPFGIVVPLLVLTGYGSGLFNGSWNSWAGGLTNSGTVLAFLHGCWGAGATLAPIVLGLAICAALATITAFWNDSGATRNTSRLSQPHGFTLAVLKDKVTLTLSGFMLIYVGAEVTIGGWLVTFMINVRNGTPSASSLVASGFWIGVTVSRFVLGWVTSYVGEKIMVSLYLVIAIGLELAFWLGDEFTVSAIMAALVGFAIGMVMPSSIRVMTKLLPAEKHIVSVGFGTAFAVSGGAIFPFAVGALAQAGGVQVLQPVILGLFAIQLLLWLVVARMKFVRDGESSA
ncbi:hypothetical protein FALBO_15215 [Fusarium albosuccineum]|uniref:Major facilitator superfamily (MFS) profile domain-containing protein n=1 Tax=Fusarium albosuccineum TaxID=1237068 RepID=A0A8H4KU80_9HYPO|nr:hypothetical protein FALBO_15215 [Fusarium albosuccineum]